MYIGRSGPVCTGEDLNEFERRAHQTYLSQLYRKSTSYDNQEFCHKDIIDKMISGDNILGCQAYVFSHNV